MVKRYDDHAFVYYNIIFETYTVLTFCQIFMNIDKYISEKSTMFMSKCKGI